MLTGASYETHAVVTFVFEGDGYSCCAIGKTYPFLDIMLQDSTGCNISPWACFVSNHPSRIRAAGVVQCSSGQVFEAQQPPKRSLRKLRIFWKIEKISQHSLTLDTVSQALELLKASPTNSRLIIISQELGYKFSQGTLQISLGIKTVFSRCPWRDPWKPSENGFGVLKLFLNA